MRFRAVRGGGNRCSAALPAHGGGVCSQSRSITLGHARLGDLPLTWKWNDVVDLVAIGAGVDEIAAAALDASIAGLRRAARDEGTLHTVWLLSRLPSAVDSADLASGLTGLGLRIEGEATPVEVCVAFTDAIDRHMLKVGGRTDLGEMAQLAAAEALNLRLRTSQAPLFDAGDLHVRTELRRLTNHDAFGKFALSFVARLTRRYLTYYLSRELPNHVGAGRRFASTKDHAAFNDALESHCAQAAVMVEKYAGDWRAKHASKGGITKAQARAFLSHAIGKITDQLRRGSGT